MHEPHQGQPENGTRKNTKRQTHLNVLDVETARGDVCCNEDWGAALFELLQNPVSLGLLLVTVHRHGWQSATDKCACV